MAVTSILYILLVISTNYQLSVQSEDDLHLDQRFNCPATGGDNTIQIDISEHNLRSISLLSPCHPNTYYGQCMYQRRACYVVVYNIPDNMWIGLFIDKGLSVPESNDELQLWTYKPEGVAFQLKSLTPGYLHRFTQYNDNHYTIAFVRYPFPSIVTGDDNYRFKIDTRMAYVLGDSYGHEGSVTGGNGGYIVSHEKFDYGTDINNYYLDDIVVELTLTGLSVNDTIRVTFLFFELNDHNCDDYLELTGILGYTNDREYICNSHEPTDGFYEFVPVGESITLRFITKSHQRFETSAGFLLEYKVIECELPEISTDSELNFTLSSRGRATVGTNISYSCNSKRYELTDGTEISTCTSNGEWSSPVPKCILIETTSSTDKFSPVPDQKTTSSTAGYIAGGVGAAVVVTLIVVVVLLLLNRRKSRNDGRERSTSPNGGKSAAGVATTEGLGRTDIQATDRTDNTYTDVYELAEYVENPDSIIVSNRNYENYKDVLTSPVDRTDISLSATARDELDVSNGHSAARVEVYELADATDDYDNHAVIERSERERDTTYASVLAANKRKFTADDVDGMIDNELYGT